MKKPLIAAAGFALSFAFVLNLYAQITYDESTGTGFVSRDEVQRVFGWKTADVKKNADDVEFRHIKDNLASWDCKWEDSSGVHIVPHDISFGFQNLLQSEADQKGKAGVVTGFNLLGIQETSIWDSFLMPGECPDEDGHPTTLVAGTLQESIEESLDVGLNGANWLPLN